MANLLESVASEVELQSDEHIPNLSRMSEMLNSPESQKIINCGLKDKEFLMPEFGESVYQIISARTKAISHCHRIGSVPAYPDLVHRPSTLTELPALIGLWPGST
jgi:hypothetical protein